MSYPVEALDRPSGLPLASPATLGVPTDENRLRRHVISLPDAVAHTVALMGPAVGAAFYSYLVAIKAGGATPLAFLLATGGCLLIGGVVSDFALRLPSAGSLYTFTVNGLGSFLGFVVGWTYTFGGAFYCPTALAGFAVFTTMAMGDLNAPGLLQQWWFWFSAGLGLYFLLSYFAIGFSTRAQLVFTAATVAILLLLAGIIIGKGGAHGNTLAAFSPGAAGVSWPLVIGGLAFAMFSFGGFETATALAEECRDPRRDIPRAVIGSVLFCGIFFVIVTYATSIGYGVREATTAWPKSAGGLAALSGRYAPYLGVWLLLAGGLASLFSGLGAHNVTARTLYAMGREGVLPRALGLTHPVHKTPHVAIILNLAGSVVVAAAVIGATGQTSRDGIGASPGPLSSGFYLFAEAAALSIPLVMLCWALTSMAGIRFGDVSDGSRPRTLRRVVISVGALLASTAALFGSLYYSFHVVTPGAGIPGPTRAVPVVMALVVVIGALVALTLRARKPDAWSKMGSLFE
jgi:amino acid transporter